MRSYVQIDSISIDLSNCIDKSSDPGKCEHFSMREYVSEIRKKDWKLCWPFPLEDSDSESEPSLSPPPSDVPKYCSLEIASEGSHKNDKTDLNCCSARCRSNRSCSNAALRSDTHQQVPIPVTFEGKEIDLNNSTNLSIGNDHIVVNNEQGKKAGVADSGINHETGVDDLNHQITSVSSPEVYGGMRQEGKTNDRGLEGKEVSDVELDTSNLKCLDKSSGDICNGGTPVAADDQYKEETEKSCTVMGVGPIVSEADNISDHTIGLPPPESVACHNTDPGGTENLAKNEFHDHHLGKSTGLPRKRPRKTRLLTDLLSGNGETKTEQMTRQGSPSEGTSIPQDKVDVQGNLTKTGQSRKRKFIVDEELMSETEPENLKENTETIDTVLNNGSSNVFVGIGIPDAVESDCCKPEIESSHSVGKKKNKKIQSVDNHLISEPQKGQQKQNQDYMDFANGLYASKITSRLAPAFTEEGMSNFPLRAPGTENESKFSKGKEKMLQVDEELSSLRCRKNGMLVEDSFAHKRAKIMPNITATVPIHSVKGALNEKELEEGLHLSLNSYLATQAYNKKHIPQAENLLPFSLPFQEGTSRAHQFIRKDREKYVAGEPFIPFKRTTNDISGKRIIRDEITGARDIERAAEVLDQVRIFRSYGYQNAQQGTEDDVPMDIVELMAKIQYERGLPDKENGSRRKKSTVKKKAQMTVGNTVNGRGAWGLLQEDQQEEKPEGRYGKNGIVMRGEDVSSHKRNSVRCFSPFDGPQLNTNSLSQTQSLFGIEVSQPQMKHSSGFQFSPVRSGQLGSCPNHQLNGRVAQLGSSEAATLQAHGGCSLHETILQQDDKASRIWGSLTSNHVSLGYDIFRNKVASQSTSTKDIQKQNMKRDIDLNYINFNASDPEKFNRKRASGSLSRINSEYPFPCKHNGGIEHHQNLRGSQQLYSNETIPAMHLLNLMDAGKQSGTPFNASVNAQMLKGPSYLWDSNDNLEIGTSEASLGPLKRPSSDHYSKSYLSEKSHGCFLGYPTFGASSSVGLDEEFAGATGLNDQTSFKSGMKDKMKSSNSAMHNGGNTKQFIWSGLEKKTSLQRQLEVNDNSGTLMPAKNISGSNTCSINRNPADFTMPETRNVYMIKGEDLKFEKASILGKRPDLPALHSCRQQKKLKPSKLRELGRH